MDINQLDYDSLIQEIHWQEIKLYRINMTKDYLVIVKPPFYRFNKRKIWINKFNDLINEERDILNNLDILYVEIDKLLQK